MYTLFNDQSFKDILTDDIVSFEQLRPVYKWQDEYSLAPDNTLLSVATVPGVYCLLRSICPTR